MALGATENSVLVFMFLITGLGEFCCDSAVVGCIYCLEDVLDSSIFKENGTGFCFGSDALEGSTACVFGEGCIILGIAGGGSIGFGAAGGGDAGICLTGSADVIAVTIELGLVTLARSSR